MPSGGNDNNHPSVTGGLGETVGKTFEGSTRTFGNVVSGLGATLGGAAQGVGQTAAGAAEGLGTTTRGLGQSANRGFAGGVERSRKIEEELEKDKVD
ncbi:uncharacterized protein N7458_009537 [Penicillium daleae]|uniref:CsbD-like domain-containing protein n=1 Tax=Penicillium daleae TaxID=63821 RepID=A0AAD6FZ06_9EURO|nr:uncharacterized protein N7458_009537 [Penicillium daleae]KAJ5438539.1 hypothetical protein N7458_009537 [Penicillium daleae]